MLIFFLKGKSFRPPGGDKIRACGISIDDDRKCDAANRTGENIPGFALMEVRRAVREKTKSLKQY